MEKMLLEVLNHIKPSKEYEKEILNESDRIIKKINIALKDAEAILGGSGAKGTWLKTFDADIFVKFDYRKYKERSEKLADILGKFLIKNFKVVRLHGSRDYFQIKEGKFTFEIVPILDIKRADQAKNITDASPLHARFVGKHKDCIDDIRLTKQFFKSAGVYGAESYIKGFSGYVCELLAIYYGSFLSLIKKAPKWKEKTVIDIKGHYKSKNIFDEINKSKLAGPLIVIDPVQKDRNASAALSYEKFNLLRDKAKAFLKKPSKEFFKIKVLTKNDLMKKAGKNKLLVLKVAPLKRKEDIAGAKMLKAFNYIKKRLISNKLRVLDSDMLWNKDYKALFYYILKDEKIPKNTEILGPPLKVKKHVYFFKKKHKKTFVRGNRICALRKSEFSNADDLVKRVIKSNEVMGNVENIKFA